MGDLDKAIKRIGNLDAAIENALKNEVAEVVAGAIADSALHNVYEAYDPQFLSRRDPVHGGGNTFAARAGGGITDPRSVEIEVHGAELIARDNPDWQQLWGDRSWRPAKRLAEAIATGDKRYHMQKAGPRPFHQEAKDALLSSGEIERALRAGLKRQGIDASGIEFEIT